MKDRVLAACRRFLPPIIRLLLRNGVNWREFSSLAKSVYVDVARQDYGVAGRPTNNSRVAMLTGLSRHEVARVRQLLENADGPVVQTTKSRITDILTGWHTDADFVADDGKPRELDGDDKERGFSALLRRHAGDMPHVALTKEMLLLGVMEQTDKKRYRVLMRDYVHTKLSPDLLTYMGLALHDHAATLDFNLNPDRSKPPMFERRASNLNISPRAVRQFFELVDRRGEEFLEEMDGWLSRHDVKDESGGNNRHTRVGVGVYVFREDKRDGD